MPYSGFENEIRRSRAGIPFKPVQTNHGFHLIWMFYSRKDCLLRNENKKDRCGSVLTPLFKHFGITLQAYAVNYNIEYVDTPYLISCQILCDETTYRFMDKEGNFLCANPRAPPPDDEMDEPQDITPDEATAYDLGPLDDDADDATYHRWKEPQPSVHEQTSQQSHRLGKKPAGSSAAGERLPRNRRTAGRSESVESD
ncbi:hypothetical protein IGI04_023443 [Brassica rapa subsp. trilocularis]|uniref:Uncharacterized protein n=1 Tax=Brassica rapa subsp. trilocularis TaxID=1813537 RepID=A0ABQ7M3W1_BRACM|nr:hypothetical protein IGI04_023443 [Brassica rapa subsp. trilocularis]